MRRLSVVALAWLLALASVAAPVVAESFHSDVYAFSITYPEGWKLGTGEGEIVTRAIGPGSAMNVSVAAASRPDFDAEGFTGAQLERIAERLATTAAGALKDFALIERDRAQLGGKPAAYFSYRAVVDSPRGAVETVGYYVATAHRGRDYSVTGVTQKRFRARMQRVILEAIGSFRFTDASDKDRGE